MISGLPPPIEKIPIDRNAVRERLLSVMDRKHHPGWSAFTRPGLTRGQLRAHFGQEFVVYVRDFPVLLARVLGQGPPSDVRHALAENIYEEETGGLSLKVPHPELFLRMIDALGIDRRAVVEAMPLPESRSYHAFLTEISAASPWVVSAAVLTIFVEGSVNERADLEGTRTFAPIEQAIAEHPMVKHYGCPPEAMGLVRAHRAVESGHRSDAWRMVLDHAGEHSSAIIDAVERAASLWRTYRDAVCRAAHIAF